jgi:hypothetical protein
MSAELELKTTLPADHVKRGQPIVLRIELTNRGAAPVAVNGRLGLSAPRRGGDLWLEIQDRAGKPVPLSARINIGKPAAKDLRELAPEAAATRDITLGSYFELKPGTYTIRAVYENTHDLQLGDRPIWRGTLESTPVTLTIE